MITPYDKFEFQTYKKYDLKFTKLFNVANYRIFDMICFEMNQK
jgi:hypothetical protein